MFNHLFAMLLPFYALKFNADEDGGGGAAEVEQVKTDEPATATEPAEQEVTATIEEPETKTFTQAELDEIVQKRISKLERKMERQRVEAETRQKVAQEMQAKPEPLANKPTSDQFSTYDEYLEALTDWKAESKFQEISQRAQQENARKAEQSESSRRNERQQELIESGERKYEDFEEVIKSDSTVYSQAAYLAILESDQSADIVYHLAKNQDDAKRIAALPAYAQAKEIGKLEDKLSLKKAPKVTSAPKPIDPIGSGSAHSKAVESMNMDEYMAFRKKQGARWA